MNWGYNVGCIFCWIIFKEGDDIVFEVFYILFCLYLIEGGKVNDIC